MRLPVVVVFCVGAALILSGCRERDAAPGDRPKADIHPTDNVAKSGDSGFAGRLAAASEINNVSLKDEALVKLAIDAATVGNDEITSKALNDVQNISLRDETAYTAALALAKSGKASAAVEIAKSLNNVTKRDELLARIAKGGD
jgi:hypothetical protein